MWRNKKPRFRRGLLTRPKSMPVLGVLNVVAYCRAAILYQLRFWWAPVRDKLWHDIKYESLGCPLRDLLGAVFMGYAPQLPLLETAKAAIKVWGALGCSEGADGYRSLGFLPLTALQPL